MLRIGTRDDLIDFPTRKQGRQAMTGKADAVRAVSQQFKDRTNTVIEEVMAHLRDDNAEEILGPGLSPLIGRGSLKSIVTFALYADVL